MPDQLEIQTATADDAAAIRALTRSAYAKWVGLIGREPLPMQVDYEEALRRHRFDLLRLDDELVALIETRLEPDHLWIENVAVSPSHQGKGLGRLMLAHAETLARSAGRTQTRLLTNQAFAANVALYRRVGYGIDRTEPFGDGVTVYMSKRLQERR